MPHIFKSYYKTLKCMNLVHGSCTKIIINIWFINYVTGKVLYLIYPAFKFKLSDFGGLLHCSWIDAATHMRMRYMADGKVGLHTVNTLSVT